MKYHGSEHFRQDPIEEVEAALLAGNPAESVQQTLERRLMTEEASGRLNEQEIHRLQTQLGYVGRLAVSEMVA